MADDEYTPPRITRREAVSKLGAAGAGAAGTTMAMGSSFGDDNNKGGGDTDEAAETFRVITEDDDPWFVWFW